MPTIPGGETAVAAEAIPGSASEIAAETTAAPATDPKVQAQATATPQLASTVATADAKVIKSGDKLPDTPAEAAVDATSSGAASQPSVPSTPPTATTPAGSAQANAHPSDPTTGAPPASGPSDADRLAIDATAATPAGGHHATAGAQDSRSTPDGLSQLGMTLTAPQTPAPAPAAQLTATAVTNLAVPVSGLAVQIAASARAGNSRFEIRLDPAELGRIDVRLDVDRHGNVTSHLTVEKPETLAMLRQDAPQLQRSLEDAGLKTGQNGLQFSLRDQSNGQQNGHNGQAERQPQRLVIGEVNAAPLAAANTTYAYAVNANRGLDIRV